MSWPAEPQRGIRYTTPSHVLLGSEHGLRRMVVLRAHRYPKGVPGKWWTELLCLQRFPYGGHYRVRYIGSWPPHEGCVPGWGEDVARPVGFEQLDLLGDAA